MSQSHFFSDPYVFSSFTTFPRVGTHSNGHRHDLMTVPGKARSAKQHASYLGKRPTRKRTRVHLDPNTHFHRTIWFKWEERTYFPATGSFMSLGFFLIFCLTTWLLSFLTEPRERGMLGVLFGPLEYPAPQETTSKERNSDWHVLIKSFRGPGLRRIDGFQSPGFFCWI
jgi:hypothetical protein